MKSGILLLYLQQPDACLHLKPDDWNSQYPNYFSDINFNIDMLTSPKLSKFSLPIRHSNQKYFTIFSSPPCPAHLLFSTLQL